MIKILALPGSLRKSSSSNKVLQAFARLLPSDYVVAIFDTGSLPHFDDSSELPQEVKHLQKEVRECDAIIICTPEYAFGIPGTLKNALDWTVGGGDLLNKKVTLITASSSGESGHSAMLLVLQALAADITPDNALVISGIRSKIRSDGVISDGETEQELKRLANGMVARIQSVRT